MKTLLKELRFYKKEVILAPLFKMLEALLDLFVPLVMKSIMDKGIANGDTGYIVKMCAVLLLIAVFSLGFAVVAQYFAACAATGFSARIRHMLFHRIQKLRFEELDKAGTSTLITRMTSDADQVQNGVNLTLRLFLRSPFIVFGAMIMAFTIDVKAALIFVVLIPVLMLIVFGIMLCTMPLYKKVQGALDKVTARTGDNLRGVRVIRAFRLEKGEITAFIKDSDNLKMFQEFVGRISAFLNPVTYVLLNVATVVLIQVGAVRVEAGLITQGALIALVNYMSQILVELVKFANLVIQMTRAGASLKRIEEVLKKEPRRTLSEPAEDPDENAPFIEFRHVSLSYGGSGEKALEDISFTIGKDETVGIIGSTGSGKSSLVSLIPGYYEATEGQVLLDGTDVRFLNPRELRTRVTTVLQKDVLFSGTVRENLVFGLSPEDEANVTDDVLEFVLKMADAHDFVMEKEGGLDAVTEEGGRNFSGGQKQRLCIARALLRNSDVLILDDASSALDFKTDATVRQHIAALRKGRATIIVTQRASGIQHLGKIIVLDEGRLVGIGSHDELMERCSVYQEIVHSQL